MSAHDLRAVQGRTQSYFMHRPFPVYGGAIEVCTSSFLDAPQCRSQELHTIVKLHSGKEQGARRSGRVARFDRMRKGRRHSQCSRASENNSRETKHDNWGSCSNDLQQFGTASTDRDPKSSTVQEVFRRLLTIADMSRMRDLHERVLTTLSTHRSAADSFSVPEARTSDPASKSRSAREGF